ncbi:MAG: TOBE domain-containing protein [Negativicutes bacterium]|nr:TOBE domain-containing protein [Negativicutes bacterium]
MAKVVIEYESGEITAIVTMDAVRELRLRPGSYVSALVKATDVMIIVYSLAIRKSIDYRNFILLRQSFK